jgi:hypothetical protein
VGLSKPRLVPDTERIKDTKTLDYASTPLDANTVLAAGLFGPLFYFTTIIFAFLGINVAITGSITTFSISGTKKSKYNILRCKYS